MMKSKHFFFAIAVLTIVALCLSSNYFNQQAEDNYRILIGIPTSVDSNSITATDYSKSTAFENKKDIDIIIFAMLNARSASNASLETFEPNAVISISNVYENLTYFYSFCIKDDSIIFATDTNDPESYREITVFCNEFRTLISSQLEAYSTDIG